MQPLSDAERLLGYASVDPSNDVGGVPHHVAVPFDHGHARPFALGDRMEVGLVFIVAIDRVPLDSLVSEDAAQFFGERRDWILIKVEGNPCASWV